MVIAYVTCADQEEARRIGRALVDERLAACVNLRAHEAIYRWNGAVEWGEEYALIAKTTAGVFPRLEQRVLSLHSYSVPCIVAVPVHAAHAPFAAWVAETVEAGAET